MAVRRKKAVKKSASKRKTVRKKAPSRRTIARKEEKFGDVMEEFGKGTLRSGSRRGPRVTSPKQAVAIAFSEARRLKKKKK